MKLDILRHSLRLLLLCTCIPPSPMMFSAPCRASLPVKTWTKKGDRFIAQSGGKDLTGTGTGTRGEGGPRKSDEHDDQKEN